MQETLSQDLYLSLLFQRSSKQKPADSELVMATWMQQTAHAVRIITICHQESLIEELKGFLGHQDVNNFLQATHLFDELKKTLFYWQLNQRCSLMYHEDAMFRELVNAHMEDPHLQLSLDFTNGGVGGIGWNPRLNNITGEGIKHLGHCHTLYLNCCENITDEEIQHLGACHTLNLSLCHNITDEGVKHLGACHTLDLSRCRRITDEGVKHLGHCHTLYLRSCDNITDEGVKYLGACHTLYLSSCSKITDEGIKHLSACHTLDLSRCGRITSSGLLILDKCHIIR